MQDAFVVAVVATSISSDHGEFANSIEFERTLRTAQVAMSNLRENTEIGTRLEEHRRRAMTNRSWTNQAKRKK